MISGNEKISELNQKNKNPYYTIDRIESENADYNIIIGERGNGKTYSIQKKIINDYLNGKGQFFLLRRWENDIKPSNACNFIDGNLLNHIYEWTNGKFSTIIYDVGKYILANFDNKGKCVFDKNNTIGYVGCIAEAERLKGQSYPNVSNIVLEEFISISQKGYEPDEINKFTNIISTIVRDRTNVKVWLLGNTVNPYNPYFNYFGIKGLELKQGQIWTKTDDITGCKLALEYCQKRRKGSLYGTSAKYFAFGNNEMIVGGEWQLPDCPIMTIKDFNKSNFFAVRIFCIFFDDHRIDMILANRNKDYFLYGAEKKNFKNCEYKTLKANFNLDLTPNIRNDYFVSFSLIPKDNINNKIIECLNNGKVWFDSKMTSAYFNNFISQSQYIK